jgi:hypothetical protein
MDDMPSAALVIRVWLEDDQQFRGRLTARGTWPRSMPDELSDVAVASSPGDVLDAVGEWLESFLRAAPQSIDNE